MTSEKLYSILTLIDKLDSGLGLQQKLDAIRDALTNLTSQPALPQHQSNLASALGAFEQAAAKLRESMTPSQFELIESMGGAEFFDPEISKKVRTVMEKNAMTPSVARDFVQDLSSRRADFLSTVRNAKQSLEKLKITASLLTPGSADLAFLIPRDIFDNKLEPFAKELTFISRLLQDFSEALTGQAQPVELEQLSSSEPTVALGVGVSVIAALAVIVNKFLDAWEKIERIRKIRAELDEMGLKANEAELEEKITTVVEEVVEEATESVLAKYPGSEERKNELGNAIRGDTCRLFGQIERGLKVEFRAEPSKDGDAEQKKALTEIVNLAQVMHFPLVPQEPMLLKGGEVLEGEIHTLKASKKTTTQKTTVSKK